MQEVALTSFHLRMKDNTAILNAGKVIGVHVGDTYTIMGFGQEIVDENEKIADGRVIAVDAFEATLELELRAGHIIPDVGPKYEMKFSPTGLLLSQQTLRILT
jgi:hypothetical protein